MDKTVILEGIVTTKNLDGTPNVSPMGPLVDEEMREMSLRPYQTSVTFHNLARTRQGVFHVIDDVELLARAAINVWQEMPATTPCRACDGFILDVACRWYALRVIDLDDREERTNILCKVVDQERLKDFFGFNRAKHAVIEAAILATRINFLPRNEIQRDFARLSTLVEKTAGQQEHRAFAILSHYVNDHLPTAIS